MTAEEIINAGSIHDIPIGKGKRFCAKGKHFAIFRETYGHFYVFLDERTDPVRGLEKGWIERNEICLEDGHKVDLRTGRVDASERFIKCILPWIENGFILFSLSALMA